MSPVPRGGALALVGLFLISAFLSQPSDLLAANRTGTFRAEVARAKTHVFAAVPPSAAKGDGVPLIISCHGSGGTAQNHIRLWEEAVKTNRVIVVAPKSSGPSWGHVDAPAIEAVVAWAFETFPQIDVDRVLLTGFSAGGHNALIQGMRFHDTFTAVAAVAGFQIQPAFVKKASHLPVLMLVGDRDGANVQSYHQTRSKLEQAGFDVTGEIRQNVGHNYPPGTSETICSWFLGHATRVKLEGRLEKVAERLEAGDHPGALIGAEKIAGAHTTGCPNEEARALASLVKKAEKEADRIWKAWRESCDEPCMTLLASARRRDRGTRRTEAARKYQAFVKAHPDTEAARYAQARLEAILTDPSNGEETADRLAGRDADELLDRAERCRDKDGTGEAVEAFRKLIREYPHTSHARKARQALDAMDVPVEPEAPCRIPEADQEALKEAASGTLRRDGAAVRRLSAILKKLFAEGCTEGEVNQVLKEVGARYDKALGQLFRLR